MARRPLRRDRAHRRLDSAVLWRLGALQYETRGDQARDAIHPQAFWDDSRVERPAESADGALGAPSRHRVAPRGAERGPGGHPGASKVIATVHITHGLPADAPMVLLIHGYAVPMPLLDALVARGLRAQGAHDAGGPALPSAPAHARAQQR